MKRIVAALAAVLLTATAGSVFAGTAPSDGSSNTKSPVIHRHFRHQHQRINQGVRSGELTKGEAKGLRSDEKSIHEQVKADKSDGNFTKEERSQIRKEQRAESRKIYREKHNERERPRAERRENRNHQG